MILDRIHYEIKLRWNKLNSNHKKDFPQAQLDDIINKVIDDYVEIFYSGNSHKIYRFGFEVTQQRIDMLNTLVKNQTIATLDNGRKYITLPTDYKHFIRAEVISDSCTLPLTIVRHNDLAVKLLDANTKPSHKWFRALGVFEENKLYIYTEKPATSVILTYLKIPAKVFSGGYNSLEFEAGDLTAPSSISPVVQTDLPERHHDILVDMCVQHIAAVLSDVDKMQISEKNILNKI